MSAWNSMRWRDCFKVQDGTRSPPEERIGVAFALEYRLAVYRLFVIYM